MNPEKGQFVKCLFHNNIVIEGFVEFWSDQKSVLKSDNTTLIIQDTLHDIMIVKIINKQNLQQIIEQKTELEEEYEEVKEQSNSDDLRLKKLAELKSLLIQQERKIVSEKVKDHHIQQSQQVRYGYPGFFKK